MVENISWRILSILQRVEALQVIIRDVKGKDISNNDTQYYPSVGYNQWLNRLDTQFNEPTNQI